jgi:hypothetical protein
MPIVKGHECHHVLFYSIIPQFLYGIKKEYYTISVCVLHTYKLDGWDANLNTGRTFSLLTPRSVQEPSNLLTN